MNYSDFDQIVEDELTGSVFGKEGQLTVLGWVEKQKDSYGKHKKIYALKCVICELDPELFGDGLCKSSKSSLVAGQVPCGCSKKPVWTPQQWIVRLRRKLDNEHKLLRLISPEKGALSGVEILCSHHGIWDTGKACNIMSGQGCRLCANNKRMKSLVDANSYTEEDFVEKFHTLGGYSRDIIFKREDRHFWSYTCNICGEFCTTRATHLYKGVKSCACSSFNQKQAYINLVLDNRTPIALKFGISKSAVDRKFRWSVYNFHLISVWEFENRLDCISAENACKDSLETGVVPKNEMLDGYSETTYLYNLDKILEIYKKFNGKEIMRDVENVFST